MPRSEAQKRADKKYIAKTYKRYNVNTRRELVPAIDEYKVRCGIDSDSGIFNAAIKYCMANNIDLSQDKPE